MLFFARKFISASLTLFSLVSVSFFLLHLLPGNPFDEGHRLDPQILAKLEHKYGLDLPLFEQYINYIYKLLFNGDLGPSLKYINRDVIDILKDAIPVSLELGLIAFILATIAGTILGLTAALLPTSFYGKFANLLSSIAMSLPSFIFAAILISIFGLQLNIFPVALWEGPEYIVLPALTLAIAPTAYIARITRSAVSANLNKNHLKTAYAKGLDYYSIILKHTFYNSLLPILTVMGPLFAMLVTGSFVVEYIYAIPGMGKYFVTAFINRDYFLVSGVVIIFSTILLAVNFIVDLLIFRLDPRLKQ